MLKIITTLSMLLAGALAQAQTTDTFTKINVKGVEVFITESDIQSVKADATVRITIKDGILELSGTGNASITMAKLESVTASDSKISVTNQISGYALMLKLDNSTFSGNVYTENLALFGESGSIFNVRTTSENVNGNFETRTKANISGNAGNVALVAQTGSHCHAKNLKTEKISAEATDDSTMIVLASKQIEVNVGDKAKVTYFGKPSKVSMNPDALVIHNTKVERRLLTQN